MEYFNNDNFYDFIQKNKNNINDNIINKIKCYDDNNKKYLEFIKNQIIFILNDNLNNFVRNSLGATFKLLSVEIISGAIPQAIINFSISQIKQLYSFATKNRKYLLDNKIKYSLILIDDKKNIEEYNKYFIEIYKFYYKYIKFIILNKEEYNEVLTVKNLINNDDLKYISSYKYLEKLYENILKSNYNKISNNMIIYIIENINIEFNIFNIYNIDILLNSYIKNLNCVNKDDINYDIIDNNKIINHTFIINILYGLYDFISYNHIKVDANFIIKTFVYILNENVNKNVKYFYLFYLSLLNDITYKLENFKLIDIKENIIKKSNNDQNISDSNKKEFITLFDNNINKLSNIINNDIKNILNNLYKFVGSIVVIKNKLWYVYNIEINKDKQYYFNIFTLDNDNNILKEIIEVNLESYLFYKYYDELYIDFNILINIMIIYLIDHDDNSEKIKEFINLCNNNNNIKINDEYRTEKIFLCVIYDIYYNMYNTIIGYIYNTNRIQIPFIGNKCCECNIIINTKNIIDVDKTFNQDKDKDKDKKKCFLHAFKKIEIKEIFPKDDKKK